MLDDEDEQICQRVLRQYQGDREYLSQALPPELTSQRLRYIRERACRASSPQIECLKWSKPTPARESGECAGMPRSQAKTGDYVCSACTHPIVKVEQLAPGVSQNWDRTWRRYLSGEIGMLPDALGMIIFRAFENGWIDAFDLHRFAREIKKYEVAIAALNAVERRARKQKKKEVSLNELNKEFRKQNDIMDRKSEAIFAKVRAGNDKYAKKYLRIAQNVLGISENEIE